jgi:histidine ammonia-lyase
MVREKVPYLDHDEPMTDHIEAVAAMFESGALLEALPKDTDAYDW